MASGSTLVLGVLTLGIIVGVEVVSRRPQPFKPVYNAYDILRALAGALFLFGIAAAIWLNVGGIPALVAILILGTFAGLIVFFENEQTFD